MKKLLLSLVAVGAMSIGAQAQLLQWNTFGNTGTELFEPSVFNDANIAAANLVVGPGVTPGTNGNRLGGSGWFDTGNTAAGNTIDEAIAGNNYIEFTVTPNAGFMFTPTAFIFNWDRSGTGPSGVVLRSSADSFAADLGSVTGIVAGAFATNTISISGLNDITVPTVFRVYGIGATTTGGTGGFDINTSTINVTLDGTTAAIPEPSTYMLLGLGVLGLVFFVRRRAASQV